MEIPTSTICESYAFESLRVTFFAGHIEYVYTDTEIRIYNCIKKPIVATPQTDYNNTIKNFELITSTVSDKEKQNTLSNLFSAINIGIIWTLEDALRIREKIDIKTRGDKYLVESLIKTTEKLREERLDVSLIHKLLLRSLFLLRLRKGLSNKYEFLKFFVYKFKKAISPPVILYLYTQKIF